jgi:ligand-binding SRPBCC domain-containing protein
MPNTKQKHKNGHCYVQISTSIPLPIADVTRWFDKDLFLYLTPKRPKLQILHYDGNRKGQEIALLLDFGLWKSHWTSIITDEWNTPTTWGFEDVGLQLPFPFTFWVHKHKVEAESKSSCLVIDDVAFNAGPLWISYLMRPVVVGMLSARRPLYKRYFYERNQSSILKSS